MNDHTFCRLYLRDVMRDVHSHTTKDERKVASGYKSSLPNSAEFWGPGGFYWHGRACCVWEAKAKGWEAWLETRKVKTDSEKERER